MTGTVILLSAMTDLTVVVVVLGLILLGYGLLSGQLLKLRTVRKSVREIVNIVESSSSVKAFTDGDSKKITAHIAEIYRARHPEIQDSLSIKKLNGHNINVPLFLEDVSSKEGCTVELVQNYSAGDYFTKLFSLKSSDGKEVMFLIESWGKTKVTALKNSQLHELYENRDGEISIGNNVYVISIPGGLQPKKKILEGAFQLAKAEYLPREKDKREITLYVPTGVEDFPIEGTAYKIKPFNNLGLCKIQFGKNIKHVPIQGLVEHIYDIMNTRANGGLRNVVIRGGAGTGKSALLKQFQLTFAEQGVRMYMFSPEQLADIIAQTPDIMPVVTHMRRQADKQTVIFVDEAEDLLFGNNHSLKSFLEGSLSALLGNPGVVFTTSKAGSLDPEIVRPGRLDIQIDLESLNSQEAFSQARIIEDKLKDNFIYNYTDLEAVLGQETNYSPKDKATLGEVFSGVRSREDWDELLSNYLSDIQVGEEEFNAETTIELPVSSPPTPKPIKFVKRK